MSRKIQIAFLWVLCLALPSSPWASASGHRTVTILFTGDTHAALGPCECPTEPMGGLARRTTAVRRIRREDPGALLVDAGGAFAGGFYDEYTMGEALDRERTELTVRMMERMGYDAVCAGDEELAFGPSFLKSQAQRVPFLSANLVEAGTDRTPLLPYLIKQVGGVRVGVVGLTTPELEQGDFREAAAGLRVTNPIEAASRIVRRLRPSVDLVVVLSHLGESGSALVAEKVPGIDVLINGHRRSSGDLEVRVGTALMVNFSYQGRQLGRVDIALGDDGKVRSGRASQVDLGRDVPDAPDVSTEVAAFEERAAGSAKVRMDLYGMGECPYCADAEQEIFQVVRALGERLEVRFYYILGEDEKGRLVSAHGDEEVKEDLRQIALQHLFPGQFWTYLLSRAGGRIPWGEAAVGAGVDTSLIQGYIASGLAEASLRSHAYRTSRLRIDRSPTLVVGNRPYAGRMERHAILRAVCGRFSPGGMPPACSVLPACVSDADCQKPGFIGVCADAGKASAHCVYRKDVTTGLTVVYDAGSMFSRESEVLDLLRTTFPGVEVERVEGATDRGRALIEKHGLSLLPAYVFDAQVAEATNFERVSGMFHRSGSAYLFDPVRAGSTVRVGRQARQGSLDIYLSPTSPRACAMAGDALAVLEKMDRKPELGIRYIVRVDSAGAAPGGRFDLEESTRQMVIRELYPGSFRAYFRARCGESGSSYWEEGARKAGIDPERVRRAAVGELGARLVREEEALLRGMGVEGDIAFVFNNREVVSLSGREALRQAVERMMGAR